MIQEHYIPKKGTYAYITWEGEVYVLKERLNIPKEELQREQNYSKIIEELNQKKISKTILKNEKDIKSSKKLKRNYIFLCILAMSLWIGMVINDNAVLEGKYKLWRYKRELQQTDKAHVLDILKNIKLENYPEETLDDFINIIFDEKSPKEEEFYSWISYAINQNPYMNEEEKKDLTIHYKSMLEDYGTYFNSKTMLQTITSLSENEVERIYGKGSSVTIHNAGENNQDLIIYDPEQTGAFGHENEHTNQPNSICTIYNEARSGYLDLENSYTRARALFTMLGHLGNEEVTLKSLINSEPDKLWQSIKRRIPKENYYKVDHLRNLIEKIDIEFLIYREDTNKIEEEILKLIEELYEIIYLKPYNEDALMYVLTQVFESQNTIYKTTDQLVLNGVFPVSLCITPDATYDITIPLNSSSYETLMESQLNIYCRYLQLDETEDKEYYQKASFWVEMYYGSENYQNIMMSTNKTDEIKKYGISFNIERIHQIINYLNNKDYNGMINLYINPPMFEYYMVHSHEFKEIIEGLSKITSYSEEDILNHCSEEVKNMYEQMIQAENQELKRTKE